MFTLYQLSELLDYFVHQTDNVYKKRGEPTAVAFHSWLALQPLQLLEDIIIYKLSK